MIYLCSTAATSYEVTKAKSSILFQNKTKNLLYLMCDALDGFYFENTVWGFYRWGPPCSPSDWILFCLISQSHRHRPVIGCPLRRLTG